MPDEPGPEDPGWAAPPSAPPPGAAPPPPPPGAPEATPSAAWAQPPAPGPPPGTAPPPGTPPRRRRGWLITLIAVMAVFLVSVIAGTALFVSNTLPPYDAANDFLNDLADGRLTAAANQLCSSDQDTPDRALTLVTQHFVGRERISVNPFGVDRYGDRATVDYTVSEERGSDSIDTFALPLREENGDWRPCPGDSLR